MTPPLNARLWVPLLAVVLGFSGHAKPNASPASGPGDPKMEYAAALVGFWESEDKFEGQPRTAVEVRLEEGKIAGTVTLRGQGEGDHPPEITMQIRDPKIDIMTVSFKTDPAQEGITEWTLALLTDDKALCTVLENDYPTPKWVLTKAAEKAHR